MASKRGSRIQNMFLRDFIGRLARVQADGVAFIDRDGRRTWLQMHERSDRIAAALQGFGLGKGQVCAILSHNRLELAEHWFACLKSGIVRAGVNWRYSVREMLHTIRDSNARVMLVEASCADTLGAHYDELAAEGRVLIGFGGDHGLPLDLEKLIASSDQAPALPSLAPADLAMIGYTSGTTGNPKGVLLSQNNLFIAAVFNSLANGYTRDDVRLYVTNPAGINIYSMCLNMVSGMTTVLDDYQTQRFIELVEEHRVTTVTVVPTMLRRIIDEVRAGHADVSSLRQVCYGTMPATPTLIREAYSTLGCTFMNRYGVSESAGSVAALDDAGHKLALSREPELLLSVGKAMMHGEVSVRDDAGHPVALGELGTVWMRGDTIMQGYLNLPKETAEALPGGGWLRTGDFGRMDERGYVFLGDRRNHMIVSGGFNVYPIVVENALAEHAAVREAVVVGVPHADWGEAIVAAVSLFPERTASPEELIEHCKARVSKFETPKHIEIVASLPRGNTDKLNKREVQKMLQESGRLPWRS
jgi:acyl-CoA synthetase (AMP-forming)/AMP-acid ligase II